MSTDARRLRQLFNEELAKLLEYRPNTFMLSRMEEQDQDGDGDEDFDDVRVARYVAGGMPKDKAINKVKRKPMAQKGDKARKDEIAVQAGSLSESMQKMSLNDRKMLHKKIRNKIIAELDDAQQNASSKNAQQNTSQVANVQARVVDAPKAGADSSNQPDTANPVWKSDTQKPSAQSAESNPWANSAISGTPIGYEIKDGSGKVILRKTEQGWRSAVRLSDQELLMLIKPDRQPFYQGTLKKLKTGDVLPILKQNLVSPSYTGNSNSLDFIRDADGWIDNSTISDDVATAISQKLGNIPTNVPVATNSGQDGALYIGNVSIRFGDGVIMTVPASDDFDSFSYLFGQDANIAAAITKLSLKKGGIEGKTLSIPIKYATERSVIKLFSRSILKDLGVGVIKFVAQSDGSYVATLPVEYSKWNEITPELQKMGAVVAKSK
jgi:hypothetical protein